MAAQAKPTFDLSQYTLAEVVLNPKRWDEYRALKAHRRVRGFQPAKNYVNCYDGRPYTFEPGVPVQLPLNAANHLVKGSEAWQLEERAGKPVMAIDQDKPRLPLLEIIRHITPELSSVEQRREPIQLEARICPLCKDRPTFDSDEGFAEHLETIHGSKANEPAPPKNGKGKPEKD